MLSPHHFGAARPPAPHPRQAPEAEGGAKSHSKPFLKRPDRQQKRQEPNPWPVMALPGYPYGPGVQRKTPPGPTPCTPSLLHPHTANPLPTTAKGGATAGPERPKPASSPSSKIPCHFFPLDPTSYLLTVVKYYRSPPPTQQVFPSA